MARSDTKKVVERNQFLTRRSDSWDGEMLHTKSFPQRGKNAETLVREKHPQDQVERVGSDNQEGGREKEEPTNRRPQR